LHSASPSARLAARARRADELCKFCKAASEKTRESRPWGAAFRRCRSAVRNGLSAGHEAQPVELCKFCKVVSE
jgi:hypothetical protein